MTKIKNVKVNKEKAAVKEVAAEKNDVKKVEQVKSSIVSDTAAKKEEVKETATAVKAKPAAAKTATKTTHSRRASASKSTRTTKAKAKTKTTTTETKTKAAVKKTPAKTEVKETSTAKTPEVNLSEVLGDCEVKLIPTKGVKTASSYPVNVALKNLGFEKVVKVRYTEDNWKTEKEEPLKFINQEDDLEQWGAVLKLNASKKESFQYVIRYKVNDWTYWDNNLDENYKF